MSNPEKARERWRVLAELAATEQDPNKLLVLATELNQLLAEKQPHSNLALPPTGTSASERGHLCQEGDTNESGIYDWKEFYEAAILETDDGKLLQRVQAAKAAIDSRLKVLQLDHGGTPEERQAIVDALAGLNVLRSECETRAHDAGSHPKPRCSLCDKPLTLLPKDTTIDDHGKPVHPECYLKNLTGRKTESPSAGD